MPALTSLPSDAVAAPARMRWGWMTAALAVLLGAVAAGCMFGPARIAPGQVLRQISGLALLDSSPDLTDVQQAILWQIRVPRVILGGLVGALLALAGAAYQGVFRNPLADPYLLGVAAGGGLGATVVIALFPASASGLLPPAAFVGGLAAAAITYVTGRSAGGRSAVSLILAGVAVAAFFTAVQTYIQQRNADAIRQVYSWILGRLTTNGWEEVMTLLPYFIVCGGALFALRRLLDVMSVGDAEATGLGVSASGVRAAVVVFATLGTAAAVAMAGLIAFVGIVVPHTVRLLAGTSYRSLIPLSAATGAAFMILADLTARTIVSPAELPIGVVTAFVGAPFFMVVLRTNRGYAL